MTPYYSKPSQDGMLAALQAGRRRHRPARDALRHPRPHRRQDRARRPTRAPPSTDDSSRSRRPPATSPAASADLRPTWPSTAATTRSTSPGWPTAPSASSRSSGTSPATEYAAMIAAVDAGDLDERAAIDHGLLPAIDGDHGRGTTARSWPRRPSSCSASSPTAASRLPLPELDDDASSARRSATSLDKCWPICLEPPAPRAGRPARAPAGRPAGHPRSAGSARSAATWPCSSTTAGC